MKVTVLGSGTSNGTPRIGGDWGNCDPTQPKNRRRRASIVVETATTRLLIDTSPDLRDQALDAGFSDFDAVLYTHDHADHCHGIDDLRQIVRLRDRSMDIYADRKTLNSLHRRFAYAFASENPHHWPFLSAHELGDTVKIGDIGVVSFIQDHGAGTTLGFRFGQFAYSTDAMAMPEAAFSALKGIDLWVVGALGTEPHPTHAHVDLTLSWIERVRPKRAVITHMSAELDYATLSSKLPVGVEPAYDGMVIEVDDP